MFHGFRPPKRSYRTVSQDVRQGTEWGGERILLQGGRNRRNITGGARAWNRFRIAEAPVP